MNKLFSIILKYGSINILLIIIGSFIAIARLVEYRTNKALQDYSMLPNNVEVVNKVILGRSYPGFRYLLSKHMNYGINKLFRSGVIELVCTDRKEILLIMKDFQHKYVAPGASDKGNLFIDFRLENGETKGNVEIQEVTFLSKGYFDNLASNYLSKLEINSIIKALKERDSNSIIFYTFERINAFYGNAEVSEVKKLVAKCR